MERLAESKAAGIGGLLLTVDGHLEPRRPEAVGGFSSPSTSLGGEGAPSAINGKATLSDAATLLRRNEALRCRAVEP